MSYVLNIPRLSKAAAAAAVARSLGFHVNVFGFSISFVKQDCGGTIGATFGLSKRFGNCLLVGETHLS